MDLYCVPLHQAALEGEVPNGIDVVCVDDREDDVVWAEDAQRADADAELLGELQSYAALSPLERLYEHEDPRLGEHPRAVLGKLAGLDDTALDDLLRRGIVAQ